MKLIVNFLVFTLLITPSLSAHDLLTRIYPQMREYGLHAPIIAEGMSQLRTYNCMAPRMNGEYYIDNSYNTLLNSIRFTSAMCESDGTLVNLSNIGAHNLGAIVHETWHVFFHKSRHKYPEIKNYIYGQAESLQRFGREALFSWNLEAMDEVFAHFLENFYANFFRISKRVRAARSCDQYERLTTEEMFSSRLVGFYESAFSYRPDGYFYHWLYGRINGTIRHGKMTEEDFEFAIKHLIPEYFQRPLWEFVELLRYQVFKYPEC